LCAAVSRLLALNGPVAATEALMNQGALRKISVPTRPGHVTPAKGFVCVTLRWFA
jgi:hypothetical protein